MDPTPNPSAPPGPAAEAGDGAAPARETIPRFGPHALGAGLASGLAGGFFGVGGGVAMIPVLTGALGFTQHEAHGTSLAAIGVTALISLAVYAAYGNVAWTTALAIGVASVITARIGARLAARTSPTGLTRAFAGFLVVVALRLLWQPPHPHPVFHSGGISGIAFDLGLGLPVGLLAGYMGVGGGILIVPALTLLAGVPQQLAQGTSLAVILLTAPVAALEHARHGNVVMRVVPGLAAGAAVGAPIAAWLAQRLSHEVLGRAFAVFLLVNAANTWIRANHRKAAAK